MILKKVSENVPNNANNLSKGYKCKMFSDIKRYNF